MVKEIFDFSNGKIAFFVPFVYDEIDTFWNKYWDEYFQEIDSNDSKIRSAAYVNGKNAIIGKLQEKDSSLFKNAQACISNCPINKKDYNGKNLCNCFSVSCKFHDDESQMSRHTEMLLGEHYVSYADSSNKSFSFKMKMYLLLNKEDHAGYIVIKSDTDTFETGMLDGKFRTCPCEETSLFNIKNGDKRKLLTEELIFFKHLFYKERLKVHIDGNPKSISIQQWTTDYVKIVLDALNNVEYPIFRTQDNEGKNPLIRFGYSMIELEDKKTGDKETDKNLKLSDIKNFIDNYGQQLYGLLVSDEGWEYVPDNYIANRFKENYFSTRNSSYTFFMHYNILIVNQEDSSYKKFTEEWFGKYKQSGNTFDYSDFFKMDPCMPGITNLVFHMFVKSIYKNLMLERAQQMESRKSIKELEETIDKLSVTLKSHSIYLKEAQSFSDCINREFGIPEKILKIQESYNHKTNSLNTKNDNEQNKKIEILTIITTVLGIFALIFSITYDKHFYMDSITQENAIITAINVSIVILILNYWYLFYNLYWKIKQKITKGKQ